MDLVNAGKKVEIGEMPCKKFFLKNHFYFATSNSGYWTLFCQENTMQQAKKKERSLLINVHK